MKKENRRIKYAGFLGLFLLGLVIALYPGISSRWNRYRAEQLIAAYGQTAEAEGRDYGAALEEASHYNEKLTGGKVPDAFSEREGEQDAEYESLLNAGGDGLMGYIEIPSVDISIPIYHYTTEEVLKKGAGHLFGSSLPVGGESTHAVLSAHRGLPDARLFTDLNLVEEGDVFYITVLSKKLAYEADRIEVVEPSETESLAIEEGKDYVTLVTCTPYAVNSHRLLVRGKRTVYTKEGYEALKSEAGFRKRPAVIPHMLCALLGLGLAFGVVWGVSGREKGSRKQQRGEREERGKK